MCTLQFFAKIDDAKSNIAFWQKKCVDIIKQIKINQFLTVRQRILLLGNMETKNYINVNIRLMENDHAPP